MFFSYTSILNSKLTIESLQHLHLLFVITPAKQLTLLDHILFALLQLHTADDARKALEVKHIVRGSHHQLVGTYSVAAAKTAIFQEETAE